MKTWAARLRIPSSVLKRASQGPRGHKEGIAFMTTKQVKNVAAALRTAAICGIAFLGGCCSWKFEGQVDNRSHDSGEATVRRKYVVKAFDVKIGSHEYNQLAFGKNPPSIADLCRCRPDVFESFNEGGGESLSVSVYNEKEEYSKLWTLLVPYMVSFGILPTVLECEDLYSVKVVMTDKGGRSRTVHFKMQIDTTSKFTFFFPIGLIPYDRSPDCIAYRGNEIFGITQTLCDQARSDRREVFLESVAYGTVAAVKMLEAGK